VDLAKHLFLDRQRFAQEPVCLVEPPLLVEAASEHRQTRRGAKAVLSVPGPNDLEGLPIEPFGVEVLTPLVLNGTLVF